jgi:hypothetical protein
VKTAIFRYPSYGDGEASPSGWPFQGLTSKTPSDLNTTRNWAIGAFEEFVVGLLVELLSGVELLASVEGINCTSAKGVSVR